jgi:long-chain acyl-CoA synthetase
MTNTSHHLTESASMYPDHPAIRMDDQVLTYAALDDATSRMVTLLRANGVEPGDRVGLMIPNVPHSAISHYGILRAGGVVVPMNPLLREREVEYYLRDSGARLLLAWHDNAGDAEAGARAAGPDVLAVAPAAWDFAAALAATPPATDPVSRSDDDTAVILYIPGTTDTTGKPKRAELTHGGLNRQTVTARTLIKVRPDDVVMGCLPLFHVFGMTCGMNAAISSGATLTPIQWFNPDEDVLCTHPAVAEAVVDAIPHPSLSEEIGAAVALQAGAAATPNELRDFTPWQAGGVQGSARCVDRGRLAAGTDGQDRAPRGRAPEGVLR